MENCLTNGKEKIYLAACLEIVQERLKGLLSQCNGLIISYSDADAAELILNVNGISIRMKTSFLSHDSSSEDPKLHISFYYNAGYDATHRYICLYLSFYAFMITF